MYDYYFFMIIQLPVPTSDPSFLGGFCHEDFHPEDSLGLEYKMSMASQYAQKYYL